MPTPDGSRSAFPLVRRLGRGARARLRLTGKYGLERGASPGRTLRVPYRSCRDASAAVRILAELEPRFAIIDIEPLVAPWNTGRSALDAGLAAVLESVVQHRGRLRRVVFATNSARRPSALPAAAGLRVSYVAHAGKPFRTGPYRRLEGPGVVVGDQIPTDGVLAWRLGLTFVHYIPDDCPAPAGSRLMHALGRPLRRVLFRPPP
jgi:hypothetical protein